ncbi:MAG TPA: hypothetical protein VGP91_05725, partial [Actinoplanes sp.]|nr:hypothetical protein [Actinoplanes sp.]
MIDRATLRRVVPHAAPRRALPRRAAPCRVVPCRPCRAGHAPNAGAAPRHAAPCRARAVPGRAGQAAPGWVIMRL